MTPRGSIVITTINAPTKAVRDFAALEDWDLIVVGDRKTPADWSLPGVTYLSAETTAVADATRTAAALPYNHYSRKMLGYLAAMAAGADAVVDTDDDNLPHDDWAWPAGTGEHLVSPPDRGFVNIYRSYTSQPIWPRGLPLARVNDPQATLQDDELTSKNVRVGIWQGLADGDPDVDAIYRLTRDEPCTFDQGPPIVLARGTVCPFNSQNTWFTRELFPLLYLPAFVTFRFTDILRGLVAQPVLWETDYALGFTTATVFQDRNPHDYMQDFVSEIPCYLHAEKVIEVVAQAVSPSKSIEDNLHDSYAALVRADILPSEEMALLDAWLSDVQQLAG